VSLRSSETVMGRRVEKNMNTLLTEEEVAERLHVSLASIRRWRLERRGPQFIKVGSLVRYRPDDLESWLASLPTGGAQLARSEPAPAGKQRYREL
jgi:excisionase family DNA binding protein